MKKLITLIAVLIGFMASAQKTTGGNYTYIAQRYEWIAGMFQGLGLPAGAGPADFKTGQERRAGAIYYDSVGIDSGTYVYSGLAWRLLGEGQVYTASEGLSKSGNDIRFGSPISAISNNVTSERAIISDSNKVLQFNSKYDGPTLPTGGANVSFAYASYAPYQFIAWDTAYTNKSTTTYDRYPQSGSLMSRRIHFPVGGGKSLYGLYGNKSEMLYTAYDSAVIRNDGGDYGGAQINQLKIRNIPGNNQRTVYKMTHQSTNDIINNPSWNVEGAWSTLSNFYLENDNVNNPHRIRGRVFGHMSYIVMGFTAADTLDEYVHYSGSGFLGAPAKLTRQVFLRPLMATNISHADSTYFLLDADKGYKSIHSGNLILGFPTVSTTSYKLDLYGASRFSDSLTLTTAREVLDTAGVDVIIRKRTDGSLLRIRPDQLGVGGGDGSKIVQTLTDGATITWDYSVGYNAEVTLGGNRTLSITNIEEGDYGTIRVVQDGTGGRTLAVTDGTISLNSGIGEETILSFYYDGTTYYWRDDAKTPFFRAITYVNPTSSDNINIWKTDVSITVSKVTAVLVGSSPSVTYQINFASDRSSGSPTTLFSSGQVTTSTTTGDEDITFADATIPAGSYIWLTTSAASGTITEMNVTIKYTND